MAGPQKTFRCSLLTPRQPVLEVDATMAVFPGPDGLVGVLPHRAPLTAVLGAGVLMIRSTPKEHYYTVRGGIAHMRDNVLTILAEQCEPSAQARLRWSGEAPAAAPTGAEAR